MKRMLLAIVLVLTISACSHGSAAPKCDQAERQLLTVRVDEARRELDTAEEDFARVGRLTLKNGDGYGMAMSRRDTALRNAQLRVADLGAFAKQSARCFTDAERAELIAFDRQINAG